MPDKTANPMPSANLFALLIGIDCYLPNRLPDGGFYPSLGGCVRDVTHVADFLQTRLLLPPERIFKLTSTNGRSNQPVESPDALPTYDNIIAAFKAVTKAAKDAGGGQVYIHYSGHGGRTPTIFAEVKGAIGLDESLVPCDIGNPGTRYVRDLELCYLLKRMTDEGLTVTVVLDSCHSGGATRGLIGSAVRGISSIDTTARPIDSLVADHDTLIASWQESTGAALVTSSDTRASGVGTRAPLSGSLWLPTSEKYVLLAACRADELANEFAFDGRERNGALTYWLLDTLQQLDAGWTYKNLHDRLLGKIHSKFPQQTPQLMGDATRAIFGSDHVQTQASVNVLRVDLPAHRILLGAGLLQAVAPGAQFAVYPIGENDFSNFERRQAIVEVTDAQPTQSWAKIVKSFDANSAAMIDAGSHAVMLSSATRVRSRIRLTRRADLISSLNQDAALARIEAAIAAISNTGWIRLAAEDESADYQVAVNPNGEFEIWDTTGRPIINLRPALKIDDETAPAKIIERLTHLTKYQNIRLLDNADANSKLTRNLVVEWRKMDAGSGGDNGDAPTDPPPLARPGVVPVFNVGESAYLRIKNDSDKALNVTVLDLQPDWGITKIYPADADSELLNPREEKFLPATAALPEDYTEGTDVLKVFATLEATSFDWLELPALDTPPRAGIVRRGAGNPLEELFGALTDDQPRTRQVVMSAPSRVDWAAKSIEMKTRRPPRTIKHVRDAKFALMQSAFDEIIMHERRIDIVNQRARKAGLPDGEDDTNVIADLHRPTPFDDGTDDGSKVMADITDACLKAVDEQSLPAAAKNLRVAHPEDETTRGALDTLNYCAREVVGVVSSLWDKLFGGESAEEIQAHAAALTGKFADCDVRYAKAIARYAQFVIKHGQIPYRTFQHLDDFIIEGKLPEDATVGLVADWGTGQPEAIEVLRQVKRHNPQTVIHLGDVYYAGTAHEVENYFIKPWRAVLEPETSGIHSYALAGNHDYYCGGQPYYDLLDTLGQPASYFCLRNAHWQIIALDTSLHDNLGFRSQPTSLEPTELKWLLDKVQNNGGRRTILLSHHQLFSTNEQFDHRAYNANLYNQLSPILSQLDLWLWGHEHDLVIFEPYIGLKRGRCIGGSAFPVGKYEISETHVNALVPYKKDVELSKGLAFYQHCYAMLELDKARATISYYEDSDGGKILFAEEL